MSQAVWIRLLLVAVLVQAVSGSEGPVPVGVLHALTGPTATAETPSKNGTLLAIEQINAQGGILGRTLKPIVVDPVQGWTKIPAQLKEIVQQHHMPVIFGGWNQIQRKAMIGTLEELKTLLFYPANYEGGETSPQIVYTGATPHQDLVAAADYVLQRGTKRFFVVATDFAGPRRSCDVLRSHLKARGINGDALTFDYTPLGTRDFAASIRRLQAFLTAGGGGVLTLLTSDANAVFFPQLAQQGITGKTCSMLTPTISERDLREAWVQALVGHLAVRSYFSVLDTPENNAFVAAYQAKFGKAQPITDGCEAAYAGVYAWKAAVETAGSFANDEVREALRGLKFSAPGGARHLDIGNQHTWKLVHIARITESARFSILWSSPELIRGE